MDCTIINKTGGHSDGLSNHDSPKLSILDYDECPTGDPFLVTARRLRGRGRKAAKTLRTLYSNFEIFYG